MARLLRITNTPRDYAWGTRGGISRLLGKPEASGPEAELWFGAHPGSPSIPVDGDTDWADLHQWEVLTGRRVPFLLKILTAATPLSLQAHPSADQAREGFERENARAIPLDDPTRNYRDPRAKPELIMAVEDGFEALCGFRDPENIRWELDGLLDLGLDADVGGLRRRLLGPDPLRQAFTWLLSGDPEIAGLVDGLERLAYAHPGRLPMIRRISEVYPGDPGLLVALLMNHVTLAAGEALWLPAGNIHAYLRGAGIELMGPSDNVLRGGLTPKHVDVAELERVLSFAPISPPLLQPESVDEHTLTYRPASQASGADVDFQLLSIDGDTDCPVGSPAIALCLGGEFELDGGDGSVRVQRGDALFIDEVPRILVRGAGRLFVAC